LQASGMIKSLTSFGFLSESWKKHGRCFQPVYGEINNDIFVCLGNFIEDQKSR